MTQIKLIKSIHMKKRAVKTTPSPTHKQGDKENEVDEEDGGVSDP